MGILKRERSEREVGVVVAMVSVLLRSSSSSCWLSCVDSNRAEEKGKSNVFRRWDFSSGFLVRRFLNLLVDFSS